MPATLGSILNQPSESFMLISAMMKPSFIRISLATALLFALALSLAPAVAQAKKISETAMAGDYSVTLKVLPAESFSGAHAEMLRDGGAQPELIHSAAHPNHHLVVFVRKDGKPVEQAAVDIRYRLLSSGESSWTNLPVVRMHVAGKGLETTHFGNNVNLAAGHYEVRVTVNGNAPATFKFSL
jgi:hypothetical protein